MSETRRSSLRQARISCPDGLGLGLDLHLPPGRAPAGGWPLSVLCHGFKGFRRWGMFPHLAERLASSGRAVALFDFSHNGVGDQPEEFTRLDLFRQQTISRHVADLRTLLDALQSGALAELGPLELAADAPCVVGHSMGGGVAILAAAADDRVAGVVTLNGVSHFQRVGPEGLAQLEATGQVNIPNARTGQVMPLGRAWFTDLERVDLSKAARSLQVPALVLQGAADTTVTPDESERLAGWLVGSRLVSIPRADHTFGAKHPWQGWTLELEAVAEIVDGFLPAAREQGQQA